MTEKTPFKKGSIMNFFDKSPPLSYTETNVLSSSNQNKKNDTSSNAKQRITHDFVRNTPDPKPVGWPKRVYVPAYAADDDVQNTVLMNETAKRFKPPTLIFGNDSSGAIKEIKINRVGNYIWPEGLKLLLKLIVIYGIRTENTKVFMTLIIYF